MDTTVLCTKCHQVIGLGQPVKVTWSGELNEHVECPDSSTTAPADGTVSMNEHALILLDSGDTDDRNPYMQLLMRQG